MAALLTLLAALFLSVPQALAQDASAAPDGVSAVAGWTTVLSTDGDVVIGVGDKLRIVLPGEEDLDGVFQVARSGRITLPEVGEVAAAGRSVSALQSDLVGALGRVYRAAKSVRVTLAERRYLIEVGGSVRKPGVYDLPAGVTVQAAIAAAGGLREGAQLNDVRVQRGARNMVVDYALYLRTGNAALLPALKSLDTVFVPTSPVLGDVFRGVDPTLFAKKGDAAGPGQSITVIGEVHNPASYTFRQGNSVVDVLVRAGGVTRYAAVNQIRILRGAKPVLFDLQRYLDTGDQKLLPRMQPGTTIFVPIQVEEVRAGKNTAYVMGQVDRPGAFAVADGTTFTELLANAGGPTRFANTRQLRILRVDGTVERFDLGAYLEGNGAGGAKLPKVAPGDAIVVPEKADAVDPSWLEIPPSRAVQVMGAVTKPGRYEWSNEMSVFDLLAEAGGATPAADLATVQIVTRQGDRLVPRIFDFAKILSGGGSVSDLPKITAGTVIMIPERAAVGDTANAASVRVMGEVHTPGKYVLKPNATVIDLLLQAGGVTRYAGIEQIRVLNGAAAEPFDLKQYLDTGLARYLPDVVDGGVIFVPQRVEGVAQKNRTVFVMGEVAKPGGYELREQQDFLSVLANSGGPTRFADTRLVRIFRLDGRVETFDLEAYAERGGGGLLPEIAVGETILVPEKLQTARPSWLDVPSDRAVQVLGSVERPGRYEWNEATTFFDVLGAAGGPGAKADISAVQIITGSGSRARSRRFDLGRYLANGGDMAAVPEIAPGTIIMLPELPDDPNDNKATWTRLASDRSIYIMGQVERPGRYAFNDGMGLLDIIAAADGPTERADLSNIRVTHRGKAHARTTPIDLKRYFLTGDESLLPHVRVGDVIYFPDRERDWTDKPKERTVRVLGAVRQPGRYKFQDDMSILDLLAEAGGMREDAKETRILVVQMGEEDRATSFDLLAFAKTGDATRLPVVRSGDTVYVPSDTDDDLYKLSERLRQITTILSPYRIFAGSN